MSNLDGAINFFYLAGGVTPAMEAKMVGQGSQYPWAVQDSEGNPFDGAKTYKLHLPPNIPVKDFWSVIVYDNQTRGMLQTDQQFPSALRLWGTRRNPTMRGGTGLVESCSMRLVIFSVARVADL